MCSNMKTKAAAIAAGLSASAAVAQSSCSNILTSNYNTPTVAAGWQAQLVVGGLTKPRSIEFDGTGALLVVESGKGVTRHTFVDNGGTCLTVEKSDLLINEPTVRFHLPTSLIQQPLTFLGNNDSSTMDWPSTPTGASSTPPPLSPYSATSSTPAQAA